MAWACDGRGRHLGFWCGPGVVVVVVVVVQRPVSGARVHDMFEAVEAALRCRRFKSTSHNLDGLLTADHRKVVDNSGMPTLICGEGFF
jgi:hypothetical protein